MRTKLAIRNVRRQIGNYLIYFITVSLTVSLMFAVNNMIFDPLLQAKANAMREMRAGLIAVTVMVACIVAIVLGYATSFMLKLRQREFGTYLTLGMTRGNIIGVFLLESLLICLASLGAGLLLGLGVCQAVTAIAAHIMDVEFSVAGYSLRGLGLTVLLVVIMFALSALTSALYLRRVRICTLLHGDKKPEKQTRFPVLWLLGAALSLGAIVGSCLWFSRSVASSMAGKGGQAGLWQSLILLAAALVSFHAMLNKGLVPLLLHSKRLCGRGTHTFVLRGLAAKLGGNALLSGALAFLIAFAALGANVSFAMQVSNEEQLDRNYPFDISVQWNAGETSAFSESEGEAIIEKYARIRNKTAYTVYTTGRADLYGQTVWSGAAGLYDVFLTESDFNALFGPLGYPLLHVDGFAVVGRLPQGKNADFSQISLRINGKNYGFCGYFDSYPEWTYEYIYGVIPDGAAAHMQTDGYGVAYDLGGAHYDAAALREELSYEKATNEGFTIERCDYMLREYGRISLSATNAVLVVAALYIAMVFVCMAMAILALKTLSGVREDKRRLDVLYRVGASRAQRCGALRKQMFFFFFLPFCVPMLLNIPAGLICAQMMRGEGLVSAVRATAWVSVGIAAVMAAIYILYYTATYLIVKRTALTN